MFDWTIALQGFGVLFILGFVTWLASLLKQDVSIVDSVWSLFFAAAALTYGFSPPANGPRLVWAFLLVGLWAIRLCGYLTWRNWRQPEDRRYREIRRNHEPGFAFKSLGIVFLFQALLAWVISLPILPVLKSGAALGTLDLIGIALFLFGLAFEVVADWQMARFHSRAENRGRVMDTGLWRYSRHPNYFGEFCLWWGFYLIALSAGSPIWIVLSPALISFLLLRISGVPLLEKDIAARRPEYRNYQARTSAFFPLPPKSRIDTGEAAL